MTAPPQLDRTRIEQAFRIIGQYLLDRKTLGEIAIYGGIGAVGEHLAQRWSLRVPHWTQRDFHFALRDPVFLPSDQSVRGIVIVESPPAFRSRLIFTRAEPLQRARFPSGVRRAAVPLEWPPKEIAESDSKS
jgi:hypothetical protein